MQTTETKNKYTVKDYMLLEEGAPFQLINYDLIMSPAPTLLHQIILQELSFQISSYLKQTNNKGLIVFAPVDIIFDDGNVLQPDLIFISEEKRKSIVNGRIDFAPNLCVEILSPSTAYYDIKQKKRIYESYGVKEYVVIDPIEADAEVYRLSEQVFHLTETISLEMDLVLTEIPGFSVPIKNLFK